MSAALREISSSATAAATRLASTSSVRCSAFASLVSAATARASAFLLWAVARAWLRERSECRWPDFRRDLSGLRCRCRPLSWAGGCLLPCRVDQHVAIEMATERSASTRRKDSLRSCGRPGRTRCTQAPRPASCLRGPRCKRGAPVRGWQRKLVSRI